MALLAIRRLGDRAYGLAIRAELEHQTGLCIGRTHAYLALDTLVKEGLAVARLGSPTGKRGGYARRYFHVTPVGLETLDVCVDALRRLSD